MKVTYDPQANAAYIYLQPIGRGQVKKSSPCDTYFPGGTVILDLCADGHLLGIELLGVSNLLSMDGLDRLAEAANIDRYQDT